MFTITRSLMAVIIALLLVIQSAGAQTDKYIIVYKGHAQKQKMAGHSKFAISRNFKIIPAMAAQLDVNQVRQLREDPDIAYIEPDYEVYALGGPDTTTGSSSIIETLSDSQTIPYGVTMVNAPAAWSRTQGAGVRVAVLDTGISMYHPDRGNVVASVSFATDSTTGTIEPVEDFDGHGTHTSGTIAAADNGIGVVGVAPQADLLIAKVMDNTGSGYTSWIISGIEWAVANNAKVINMSLGSANYSAALDTACSNAFAAGTLLVAAAGNDGKSTLFYPAALSSVIAVAAIDQDKNQASFSNYGSDIALAAPGVQVYSTIPLAADPYATANVSWNSVSHLANIFTGTADGVVSGTICDCGLATGSGSDVCPPAVAGNIAFIRRGTNYFSDKVAYAQSKGAVGVIIANNVSGNFNGTLNSGSPLVAVSISKADGDALHSLIPSGITGTVSVDANLYASYSGTSMACPHVAGVAALVYAAAEFDITPSEVRTVLLNSAQDLGTPGPDDIFGYGLVDASAALSLIAPGTQGLFTISGRIDQGYVTMSGLPGNPVTNGAGFYTATVPSDWSGTVTPTRAGYAFTPPSRSYTNLAADQTAQNYVAEANQQGLPLTLTQFAVKAGKTRSLSGDSFTIAGMFGASSQDIFGSMAIHIRLSNASEVIFEGVIPYDSSKLKKGKYSYTRRTGDTGTISSASFDLNKKTFRAIAKGIDLTGLSCPVTVELEWGSYLGTVQAAENIINGKQLIPMPLLIGYADALRVDKASVHTSTKINGDSLTVKGAIAFASAAEDLTQHQLTLHWGVQDFNVPAGGFVASTNGRYAYTSPKGTTIEIEKATFDLEKCTFAFSVKNVTIVSRTGPVSCGITCDAFDQSVAYTQP